jgi:Uma2 family endonuclease
MVTPIMLNEAELAAATAEGVYKRLYTVEEYDAFRATAEAGQYELIHGEIVEKYHTEQHGVIVLHVGAPLLDYVRRDKLGYIGVEISHRRPGDRYNDRQPDISFRAARPGEPVVEQGSVMQMPDFAVEVKSPNDTYQALRRKAEYLIQNGTKLVWLVYPEKQAVEVCTPSAEHPGAVQIRAVAADGVLDGGAIFPGFTLPVREIFNLG